MSDSEPRTGDIVQVAYEGAYLAPYRGEGEAMVRTGGLSYRVPPAASVTIIERKRPRPKVGDAITLELLAQARHGDAVLVPSCGVYAKYGDAWYAPGDTTRIPSGILAGFTGEFIYIHNAKER